jgi:hypothetical protein
MRAFSVFVGFDFDAGVMGSEASVSRWGAMVSEFWIVNG